MNATATNQSDIFFGVFVSDLAPNQDEATTGAEVVDGARAVVAWYAGNDPESNLVPASDAPAFLNWFDTRREELIIVADRAFAIED